MSEKKREAIVELLAATAEIGDLIPETGGLRKVRVPLAGRGKRGGARIIYYYYDVTLPIYLLLVYAKNERDDLSGAQKVVLRDSSKPSSRGGDHETGAFQRSRREP